MQARQVDAHHLEQVPCNLCGSTRSVLWRERLDKAVNYRFRNVRCSDCGLIYVSPRLQPGLRATFNSWEFIDDRESEYEAHAAAHVFTAKQRLARLERFLRGPGTVLDVGCAMGYFLHTATQRWWKAFGVEFDPRPAARARERFGLQVKVGTLEQAKFEDGQFDCVHVNDVIEHLPDPFASLQEIKRILKPGGIAFVGTHNVAGVRAHLDGDAWRDLGGLDHLFCFSPKTLRAMMRKAGFDVLQTVGGEGLGLVAAAFRGRPITQAFEAVESSATWRFVYNCSALVRTATLLGSEVQVYARRR